MKIEQIQRSEETRLRANATYTKVSADEGKKLINQDYLDGIKNRPIICIEAYLADVDSPLDWAEITEAEAEEYQQKWDKEQEELDEAERQKAQNGEE